MTSSCSEDIHSSRRFYNENNTHEQFFYKLTIIMSFSSESYDSDSSLSSISILNISKLQHMIWNQPFNQAKLVVSRQKKELVILTDVSVVCACGGKCHPMETYTKSICCCEVPDEYFHGENFKSCLFLQ